MVKTFCTFVIGAKGNDHEYKVRGQGIYFCLILLLVEGVDEP